MSLRNPYRQLQDLLGAPPLQAGTVTAVDDGVATVSLPDGGKLLARGDAAVGQNVFVRGDVIEGPAPDLTIEIIEV